MTSARPMSLIVSVAALSLIANFSATGEESTPVTPQPCEAVHPLARTVAVMSSLGFFGEALAAAGLPPQQVQVMHARIAQACELRESLSGVLDQRDAVQAAHAQGQEEAPGAPPAEQQINALNEQVDVRLNQIFALATADLDSGLISRLAACRASLAWDVPPQFRVVERSASEWAALTIAIKARERALRLGAPLGAGHEQVYLNALSSPAVQEAMLSLQVNLDAMNAEYASALEEELSATGSP